MQNLMKIKGILSFGQLNHLNINVFELSANDKTLSPKWISQNYYED